MYIENITKQQNSLLDKLSDLDTEAILDTMKELDNRLIEKDKLIKELREIISLQCETGLDLPSLAKDKKVEKEKKIEVECLINPGFIYCATLYFRIGTYAPSHNLLIISALPEEEVNQKIADKFKETTLISFTLEKIIALYASSTLLVV